MYATGVAKPNVARKITELKMGANVTSRTAHPALAPVPREAW